MSVCHSNLQHNEPSTVPLIVHTIVLCETSDCCGCETAAFCCGQVIEFEVVEWVDGYL